MNEQASQRRLRTMAGAGLVAGSVFVATLCFLCLGMVLPQSALHLSKTQGQRVSRFFPQGRKFFTKDPLSADFLVYRRQSPQTWVSIAAPSMGSRENLWGADRIIRTQGLELAMLLADAGDALRWTECDDTVDTCASGAAEGPLVDNHAPIPTLCGDVAVTRERPVPWAWRHLRSRMPYTIARVRVRCSNG